MFQIVRETAPLLPVRSAPVPDGRGHCRGILLEAVRRGGYVRLRAARPAMPGTAPSLPVRENWSSRTPGMRKIASPIEPGLLLLYLPELQPGLPPASLSGRRDPGHALEHDPQPSFLSEVYEGDPPGHRGRPASGGSFRSRMSVSPIGYPEEERIPGRPGQIDFSGLTRRSPGIEALFNLRRNLLADASR